MVKLYMLPAQEGDFFWIVYGKKKCFHILIDGGMEKNGYVYADIIKRIYERNETISALILTHIDIDHIQGAIKGIGILQADLLKSTVKNIYFNTCRGIWREYYKKDAFAEYGENDIKIRQRRMGYGVGDAITFLELLKEKEIIDCLCDYTVAGDCIILDEGAVLKIISPGEKELADLSLKWEKYEKKRIVYGYASNSCQLQENLRDLKEIKLTQDGSVNNRSSIAMLFEYGGIRIALLADSAPSVCQKGLELHEICGAYPVDALKISHHGSRSNTSDGLLKAMPTNCYLLSTNGHGRKVPSKIMIAHLLKVAETYPGGILHLLCNYKWWETTYHGKYFTVQDEIEYIKSGKINLKELSERAFRVKDGFEIYGDYT